MPKNKNSLQIKNISLFIAILILGFALGIVYSKNHLQPKTQIVYEDKKYPNEFILKTYKDRIYKLQWEAYYIPESENLPDNPLSKKNYDTKLTLVRAPITAPKQNEIVKNLDLALKGGRFDLEKVNSAENEVQFSQSAGWISGRYKWNLNLETGEYKQVTN